MKTLENQLQEYGAFHEREQGNLLLDEVGILATTRPPSRSRYQRPWLIAAAAVVSVLVLIGGFGLLTRIQNATDESPVVNQVEPEESPVVDQVEPEEPPVVEEEEPVPSPSTTLPSEAVEPSAPITGMAWQQVIPDGIAPTTDSGMTALVSGGDRFLYVDVPNNTVGTSFDGINWTSRSIKGSLDRIYDFVGWQDTIVGFGCGGWVGVEGGPITPRAGCVSVIHPDGTVARHSFDGQINGAGIGPSGMVAIVTNNYDEDGLQYVDAPQATENLTGRDINDFSVFEVTDGVLHLETNDGQVSDYVLSDHGYADSESQVVSGWFSQDGEAWIPIADFPSKTNPVGMDWDLIGTEDGFVGTSDDRDGGVLIWHSSNGLDWRELGQSPGGGTDLSRWSDGAIVAGAENNFWYVSGLGIVETPLATTGVGEIFISTSDKVGVVIVGIGDTMELSQVLYSPDGQEWTNTNMPPDMRESLANLGWPMFQHPIEVAATDTGVLLRLSVGGVGQGLSTSVWFLGTPITD